MSIDNPLYLASLLSLEAAGLLGIGNICEWFTGWELLISRLSLCFFVGGIILAWKPKA